MFYSLKQQVSTNHNKNKKKREQEKNRHTFSQRRHLKAELRPGSLARFRFFAAAATTGLKGREKMIVVNPQTVTNRELAALAMQAKGRSSSFICTGRQVTTKMFMMIIT